MANVDYAKALEGEMQKIAIGSVTELLPGDPYRADKHAVAVGRYAGLKTALDIYRNLASTDLDPDGDL